jgi:modulator of FtsH protease HflK
MSWDWEKLKQQQGGRGGIPPQVDDIMQGLKKFKLPGGPIVIVVLLALLVAATAFYTVNQDEVGVVQRFGRYTATTQPGLNFKLPLGIDSVTKVNVKAVRTEEFGGTVTEADFRARARPGGDPGSISLMLTGDLNVALVPWIVQYRIKDPYNFLFKVNDVRRLLNDMSEAVMRLVVGDRSINEVISKRGEIANEAQELLQRELDLADAGIHIVTVELMRTNVPVPVQPSFNEVNQATQEREQLIYQANEEYNKAIPAARGSAERTIREAEGYALNRVNRAQGDASRFSQIYDEYRKAKDVTARRLYLEKMRTVLANMGPVYIVDPEQKSALPLLNLMNPAVKEK